MHDALLPGGAIILTVPAHQSLFDEADRLAFHRRRYNREGLRHVLEGAGLEVRLMTHFMLPLAPMLVLVRGLGRLFRGSSSTRARRQAEFATLPGINALMRAVLAVERTAMRVVSLPFGTSIIAVAVRTH